MKIPSGASLMITLASFPAPTLFVLSRCRSSRPAVDDLLRLVGESTFSEVISYPGGVATSVTVCIV